MSTPDLAALHALLQELRCTAHLSEAMDSHAVECMKYVRRSLGKAYRRT